ncbi:hypothetical protein Hanom_Chr06g00509371 [Helianthus anomalus]
MSLVHTHHTTPHPHPPWWAVDGAAAYGGDGCGFYGELGGDVDDKVRWKMTVVRVFSVEWSFQVAASGGSGRGSVRIDLIQVRVVDFCKGADGARWCPVVLAGAGGVPVCPVVPIEKLSD